MNNRSLVVALFGWLAFASARANGDDFPQPHNAGNASDEKPLSAEEAAAGFKLPPGFKAQVFASEPDVQNPVAMTWDNRGRLWVAECYTYANRPTRYDLALRDRVIILHDTDGDGRADLRKVFCDNVQQLMSVEVGLGGVWLIALPRVLFIPDRNGDDVPDGPPEVILDGFETSTENYHNCASGLKWGPDGWLYGRCGASSPGWIGPPGMPKEERTPIYGGIWRYHPTRKTFEVLCHGFTNPWGHDWDEHGEMFITNTVTGHLFHLIPGAHHTRSATIGPNRYVYDTIDSHADHFHYDTGRGWKESLKEDSVDQLGGGHAHCGACIYLGDNWPAEYRGKLLTLNLHGRRINVERLEREGSGYTGRHEPDIAHAADPWFRGIDLNYGPDGAVYIIDWSDTGECHEHDGIHRTSGRVFRISHEIGYFRRPDTTDIKGMTELLLLPDQPNEWLNRHIIRRFADGPRAARDVSVLTARLRPVIDPIYPFLEAKLRALWTLNLLDSLSPESLRDLLDGNSEEECAWAVRLLTESWPLDTVYGKPQSSSDKIDRALLPRFVEMANDPLWDSVRLVLASTLQRLPPSDRPALAAALLAHKEDANDHNLPKLIWYGLIPLVERDPAALVPLAVNGKLPLTREWIARALAENPAKNAEPLNELLATSLNQDAGVRADIVRGLAAGMSGLRKVPKPPAWDKFVAATSSESTDQEPQLQDQLRGLSVLFGDGLALDEVRRIALSDKAKMQERKAALETLLEARPDDLKDICQKLLRVRFLNMTAMKGLTLFEDPEIAQQLARSYTSFHATERPAVIETLASRPSFATALLAQIEAGRIPAADLTALQARQIRSFGDTELTARLAKAWGDLRDSPQEKQDLIGKLKSELEGGSLAKASAQQGRAVFQTACANCHRLFGAGGTIGPDLTGSGRHNLDYLLSNIVDPSAVVNKDFRMSVLRMADGRVLNGLIVKQDDQRLELQTAKELLPLMKSEIEEIQLTTLSPMPEGLLQPLQADQIRDLIGYLMSPTQVGLPNSPKP